MRLQLVATTTFGLEAVVKREIQQLGYRVEKVEDGKVYFFADERGVVRANLWLRSADRVLICVGKFSAKTFEELFQQTKGVPWEHMIGPDGKLLIEGSSVKSTLHSVPACQRIVHKAVAQRLMESYGLEYLEEQGATYKIKVSLLKDQATLTVDTSGTGLHKRGYRGAQGDAPLKETLAAALVQLSFWNPKRILWDPFCGSGTIPIEAALIGKNIAPGLLRTFAFEDWDFISPRLVEEERKKAKEEENREVAMRIHGSDINKKVLTFAKENAQRAGVLEHIVFSHQDVKQWQGSQNDQTIFITNPPYGERMGEGEELKEIYAHMRGLLKKNEGWSLFLITADEEAETLIFPRAVNRRRKLYNGRIKTCYYQYHGKKPG